METKIRFRNDSILAAELKGLGQDMGDWSGAAEEWDRTPPADPGDLWTVRFYSQQGEGPIAGYAICCPACRQVHYWCSASNCPKNGVGHCAHYGKSSCWTWTGSAEQGTLSASPSLFAQQACGWHGWLQNGVLRA